MHLDQSNDWGDRVCSCGESSVTPHSVIKEDVLVGTWGRYLGTWKIPDSVDKQDVWVIGEYTWYLGKILMYLERVLLHTV